MNWGLKAKYAGCATGHTKVRSVRLPQTANGRQINIGLVKLYLSPILDMFTGEIISYNISRNPNLEQIYDMLDKTFARFDSLILHSDEGWQYQHYGYRKRLEEHL